jgi:hypothetical protein
MQLIVLVPQRDLEASVAAQVAKMVVIVNALNFVKVKITS